MTKFMLIVWFGVGQTQVFDTSQFDTKEECESAKAAVEKVVGRPDSGWLTFIKCVPYGEPHHD